MRPYVTLLGSVALLSIGYLLGASNILAPSSLLAQAEDGDEDAPPAPKAKPKNKGEDPADAIAMTISEESRTKIRAAAEALTAAMDALKTEGRYNSVTRGLNMFAILAGGSDAVKDLESGRGVDPETFAALYSDLVIDQLADKLARDSEGRLTYNGKLVRMYPVSRLKTMFAVRGVITGEELFASQSEDGEVKRKRPAAPAEEPEESEQ